MSKLICISLFTVLLNTRLAFVATELLHNADFESSSYTGNWYCQGNCHMTQSNDALHGSHSAKVTNRNADWNGAGQHVNMNAGHRYKVTSYIKLLSIANNAKYQEVKMMVSCQDSQNTMHYMLFGRTPRAQQGQWFEVGGLNKIPNGYHGCSMYLQTAQHVDYLVDQASVQEVTLPSNWKTQADSDIDRTRKANINIQLTGSADANSNLQIELTQTGHEFVFGSAVDVNKLTDNSHTAYQKAFYDNFEWGVPENALKWRQMEGTKDHINYNKPLNAINAMHAHGKKIRGHCVFWSVEKYIQDWVKSLYGQTLLTAISSRIQGIIGHTKGMLEQWDVNNENLHSDFYETHTGNPDITMEMFRQVHAVDTKPQLFLNEYNAISSTEVTVALKNDAVRFKNNNVPIGGIGVQSHMHTIDLPSIKGRLDILGEAGLPIMVTELGVNDANVNNRASKLSDLMYLFFSHPSVQGIMFWGFWDGQIWEKDAPLFSGTNVTPNAAGLMYQSLKQKWTTHSDTTIHGHNRLTVRGFKGTYTLKVKHNGNVLKTEAFTLGDTDLNLDVHLNGQSGNSPSISHIVVG